MYPFASDELFNIVSISPAAFLLINELSLMYCIPSGIFVSNGGFVETDLTSISSLTILYVLFGTSFLLISRVTVVPFSPLILSAAASTLIPLVLSPLISIMASSA